MNTADGKLWNSHFFDFFWKNSSILFQFQIFSEFWVTFMITLLLLIRATAEPNESAVYSMPHGFANIS